MVSWHIHNVLLRSSKQCTSGKNKYFSVINTINALKCSIKLFIQRKHLKSTKDTQNVDTRNGTSKIALLQQCLN